MSVIHPCPLAQDTGHDVPECTHGRSTDRRCFVPAALAEACAGFPRRPVRAEEVAMPQQHPYPCLDPYHVNGVCAAVSQGNCDPNPEGKGCDLRMRQEHPCVRAPEPDHICTAAATCGHWDGDNPGRCPKDCPAFLRFDREDVQKARASIEKHLREGGVVEEYDEHGEPTGRTIEATGRLGSLDDLVDRAMAHLKTGQCIHLRDRPVSHG